MHWFTDAPNAAMLDKYIAYASANCTIIARSLQLAPEGIPASTFPCLRMWMLLLPEPAMLPILLHGQYMMLSQSCRNSHLQKMWQCWPTASTMHMLCTAAILGCPSRLIQGPGQQLQSTSAGSDYGSWITFIARLSADFYKNTACADRLHPVSQQAFDS